MLELAGLPAATGPLPGKSLVPLIREPGKGAVNDHILMAFGPTFGADIVRFISGQPSAPMNIRAIFDGEYKYARYFGDGMNDEYEMYDLTNDSLEMKNLAGDPGYRAVEKEMSEKLREAVAREMAPVPAGRR